MRCTICDGYSNNLITHIANFSQLIRTAFLVDYDFSMSGSNAFTHWSSFAYPANTNYVCRFQVISRPKAGYYTISADTAISTTKTQTIGSLTTIPREADGSFGAAK